MKQQELRDIRETFEIEQAEIAIQELKETPKADREESKRAPVPKKTVTKLYSKSDRIWPTWTEAKRLKEFLKTMRLSK